DALAAVDPRAHVSDSVRRQRPSRNAQRTVMDRVHPRLVETPERRRVVRRIAAKESLRFLIGREAGGVTRQRTAEALPVVRHMRQREYVIAVDPLIETAHER